MGGLIEEGCIRRTITAALLDSGLQKPFPLEGIPANLQESLEELREHAGKLPVHKHNTEKIEKLKKALWLHTLPAEEENTLEEFAWAFGEDTVNEIERICIIGRKSKKFRKKVFQNKCRHGTISVLLMRMRFFEEWNFI